MLRGLRHLLRREKKSVQKKMNTVGYVLNTVSGPFHPLGGAVDIIVVKQEDGTFKSTPFYVRFGKFQGVLKRRDKLVHVAVNGVEATSHMYMDHRGQCYFLVEKEVEGGDTEYMLSPPSCPESSGDEGSTFSEYLSDANRRTSGNLDSRRSSDAGAALELLEEAGTEAGGGAGLEGLGSVVAGSSSSLTGADPDGKVAASATVAALSELAAETLASGPARLDCSIGSGTLTGQSSSPAEENPSVGGTVGGTERRSPPLMGRSVSAPPKWSKKPVEVELRSVLSMSDQATTALASPRLEVEDTQRADSLQGGAADGHLEKGQDTKDKAGEEKLAALLERDRAWREVLRKAAAAIDKTSPITSLPSLDRSRSSSRKNSKGDMAALQESAEKASWGWGSWWTKSSPQLDKKEGSTKGSARRASTVASEAEQSGELDGVPTGDKFEPKAVVRGFKETEGKEGAESGSKQTREQAPEVIAGSSLTGQSSRRSLFTSLFSTNTSSVAPAPTEAEAGPPGGETALEEEGFSRANGKLDVDGALEARIEKVLSFKKLQGPLRTVFEEEEKGTLRHEHERQSEGGLNRQALQASADKVNERRSEGLATAADDGASTGHGSESTTGAELLPLRNALQGTVHFHHEAADMQDTRAVSAESMQQFSGPAQQELSGSVSGITDSEVIRSLAGRAASKEIVRQCLDDLVEGALKEDASKGPISAASNEKGSGATKKVKLHRGEVRELGVDKEGKPVMVRVASDGSLHVSDSRGIEASIMMAELETELLSQEEKVEKETEEALKVSPVHLWDGSKLSEAVGFDLPGVSEHHQGLLSKSSQGLLSQSLRQEKLFGAHDKFEQSLLPPVIKVTEGEVKEGEPAAEEGSELKGGLIHRAKSITSRTTPVPIWNAANYRPTESTLGSSLPANSPTLTGQFPTFFSLPNSPTHVLSAPLLKERPLLQVGAPAQPEADPAAVPIGQSDQLHSQTSVTLNTSKPGHRPPPSLVPPKAPSYSEPVSGSCSPMATFPLSPLSAPTTPSQLQPSSSYSVSSRPPPLGSPRAGSGEQSPVEVPDNSDPLRATFSGSFKDEEGPEELRSENDGGVAEAAEGSTRKDETGGGLHTGLEVSLCRHMLSPGMGSEAAAAAFAQQEVLLEKFASNPRLVAGNDRLVVRVGGRYYPWAVAAPTVLGLLAFGQVVPPFVDLDGAIPVEKPPEDSKQANSNSSGWRLWPFGSRNSRSQASSKRSDSMGSSHGSEKAEGGVLDGEGSGRLVARKKRRKLKMRTLNPTSEWLSELNLQDGKNQITFTFTTNVLGKQEVDATVFLWQWDSRIVISDIDGTITKSDVLGQVMPLVGKDWSQSGVTSLFSSIKENGYEFMYLSARAISQATITRRFLTNIKQDGQVLPDGPVVISPDGLIPSLYREVIRRTPHEFKIACLNDIRSLFPPDTSPFYAGFGNRDTDEISYMAVGVPRGKIFIINPRGEVYANSSVDVRNYTSMNKLVNDMFPAVSSNRGAEKEDFNSWNFWKMPIPDIDDDALLDSKEAKRREEERRRKEQAQRQAQARKREEDRRREELRRKEEQKRLDLLKKKAEEDRKREELRKKDEAKRRDEERRKAEAKKKEEDLKRVEEDRKRLESAKRLEEGARKP